MTADVYQRLREHLDNLPGGYPATASGIELRILRRLFTPEHAALAVHLTLLTEPAEVIARRAGLPVDVAAARLDQMEKLGLLSAVRREGQPAQYAALQFVVGIWEAQVRRLDADFAREFSAYLPELFDTQSWAQVPQLRTIPVGEAVDARVEVLPYEAVAELVKARHKFAVAPCICRTEKRLLGEGCDKPLETCLTFGSAAVSNIRNGIGREISREEALQILRLANEAGLVLSPANNQDAHFVCMCCGCCCGVLRSLNQHPAPGRLASSPFFAVLNSATCEGCGTCVDRCQMDALRLDDGKALLDPDRCIGCGLCVSTCPTASLELRRKPDAALTPVPKDAQDEHIRLGKVRGKLSDPGLVGMVVKSRLDRLLSRG